MIRLWSLLHTALVAIGGALKSPFLLAIRLYWGWQFVGTGWGKLSNAADFAENFQKWGLPFPKMSVYLAGTTECLGGWLLIFGLFSRLISVPLIFTMIVAYLTAEIETVKNLWSKPDDLVSATPFLFLLASLIIFIFGPGFLSMDRIFRKNP
jgi:putative oxidoreductase